MSRPSYASVIKNPGFSNLWINQILVQFTANSLNFALIIWVFRLTDSNTALSALLFSVYLPAVLFGLFAGVFVDVIDRKKIFLMVDFLLALLIASLTLFKYNFPAILVISFLINTLIQIYIPTESSSIPLVVKKEELLQANSLFTTTLFMTFLMGFGLAGPLIAIFRVNSIFILGSVLLTTAFLLANFFPSITTKPDQISQKVLNALRNKKLSELKEPVISEIKDTLNLIRGKLPVSSSIIILAGVQATIGVLAVLIPSFLERILQIRATDASYILIAPLGLGMIIGALLVGRYGYLIPRRKLVGRAILVAGAILFSIGFSPLISPAIKYFPQPRPLRFFHQPSLSTTLFLGSFILGMAVVCILIPSQTVLQENTPEEDRGKVFAVLGMVMAGLTLLPVLFAGVLADIFGTLPIFIGMGGLIILSGLFTLKPDFFFAKGHLPFHIRQFLGLGHWEK